MKYIFTLLLIYTSLSSSVWAQKDSLTIENLIQVINTSLENSQLILKSQNVKIKSAVLALETSYSTTGKVGFDIWLLSSAKKWARANTNTFTLSFEEPDAKSDLTEELKLKYQKGIIPKELTPEILTQAILNSATIYNQSSNITSLVKDNFTMKLSFRINDETDGGLAIEVFGLGISGDGNLSNTFTHSITLKFETLK